MSPDGLDTHSAQLTDVWLSHLDLRENSSFELGTHVIYAIDFKTHAEVDRDGSHGHLDLTVRWLDREGHAETDGPFDLDIGVTGEFAFDSPGADDADQVRRWIELNATHLLWSYARAYLSAVTGFSRYPPLTLFTITIPPLDPETGEFPAVEGNPGATSAAG